MTRTQIESLVEELKNSGNHYAGNILISLFDKVEKYEMEEAVMKAMANFGAPRDLFLEDGTQIMKDGQPTEEGMRWYTDTYGKTLKVIK